jgi:hypothetical protein
MAAVWVEPLGIEIRASARCQVRVVSNYIPRNLVSTAEDLATFFTALFDGKLLPKSAVDEMKTTTVGTHGEVLGLGLQVITLPCGTFVGHSGDTPGASPTPGSQQLRPVLAEA